MHTCSPGDRRRDRWWSFVKEPVAESELNVMVGTTAIEIGIDFLKATALGSATIWF
ncbi:hypothetical protein RISK_002662 [Rhodopirellula islandica]|uniref:Uncharacterized protein n=1 Tax=Rhodopirellula islandica TaxID=595434 RepID=A0A0J1EIF0_RHOIS|nr:hypothetical protein RISK_002662 [Rhodopirellula islandica]